MTTDLTFDTIERCASVGREKDTVVACMDGALLMGRSSFPYFAVVAFEGGGILRLLFLLLASPLAGALYYVSESGYYGVLVFATFAGMRVSDVEWVARAVLPRFYSRELHPETWRVFSSCGRRCVVAASPRMMVEPFLKEYLGAEMVVGTEIGSWRGRATGFVNRTAGVLVGNNKALALQKAFQGKPAPDIGLGSPKSTDYHFMKLCKESYIVPVNQEVKPIPQPNPIVFHDGRLVHKHSPISALLLVMWIPIGFVLACLRIATGILPMPLVHPALRALGVRIHIKGNPPSPPSKSNGESGSLFVCSHRTAVDPVMLSVVLGRPVPVVTYSISRLSELFSPVKLIRLTRDRSSDASLIKKLLGEGDLVICPEGTTCREPFLLRFSSLFAELTDELIPVAMSCQMSMFHGTTGRGWKGMDPYYFFMNPSPIYEVTFLDKLPKKLTCGGGGRTRHEVANYIQRMLAASLSFECTTFTRKDKYRALVGKDDIMMAKSNNKVPHPQ